MSPVSTPLKSRQGCPAGMPCPDSREVRQAVRRSAPRVPASLGPGYQKALAVSTFSGSMFLVPAYSVPVGKDAVIAFSVVHPWAGSAGLFFDAPFSKIHVEAFDQRSWATRFTKFFKTRFLASSSYRSGVCALGPRPGELGGLSSFVICALRRPSAFIKMYADVIER